MSLDSKDISNFYDEYTVRQKKSGVNTRHRTILKKLKKAGLKPSDKILEVGCGIGTLTGLLANYVDAGKVTAVDISPKSIEVAKQTYANKKIDFLVSDMSEFNATEKFDFIILPDVLEHIPIEQHKNLFKVLHQNLKAEGTVAINIPDPYYLAWVHMNRPELLQIIDQSIYTDILTQNIYPSGLYIHKLETYSITMLPHDYQWILLKKKREINFSEKTTINKLKESIKSRI